MRGNFLKVRLSGGLGNQLFQFSNALRVSEIFSSEVEIDLSWFKHKYMKSNKVSFRNYELDFFPKINDLPKFFATNPNWDRRIGSFGRRLNGNAQNLFKLMTEKNVNNFKGEPKIIDGVFANLKYLPNDDKLKNYLQFPSNKQPWLEAECKKLKGNYSVAVHVRMGDFLNLKEIYGVLDTNYYITSMQFIKSRNPSATFHLFSDSTKEALDWLGSKVQFDDIVNSPKNSRAGEVLNYMSEFNGLICANSTFSWWAGYIGSKFSSMETVILPKIFSTYDFESIEKSLKLDEWIVR